MPKTGTTAFQSALSPHADIVIKDPPQLKHAPVYRYNRFFQPMFEKACKVEMETLAVMREPISWLGSWYRYRQRPFMKGKPNSTAGLSFDQFIEAYMNDQKPGFANVGVQSRFLEPKPGGTPIDHLFRYEEQPSLVAFLKVRLGLTFRLERKNVSPPMDLQLSSGVETAFRKKFAPEFALYNSIS
ncbi:MAG: gamma-glutamyl kinase [Paracoccaceae bacterium]